MDDDLTARPRDAHGWPDWLTTHSYLGSHYPFYAEAAAPEARGFHLDVGAALESIPAAERVIDPAGIVEVVEATFLLGDRTLVRGLRRAPWMGRPDHGGWSYAPVPPHGEARLSAAEGAARLKAALHAEARTFLAGRASAGILLSGGLDSRIAAGVLREAQLSGDYGGQVVALTWGLEGTRDVAYARDIARRYGWEWVHFGLTPGLLERNIHEAGWAGAEFSPVHLHALPQVRDLEGLDVVVAGSYGDSVGRAEFSGVRVPELAPTLPRRLNRFGVLRHDVVAAQLARVEHDTVGYRAHVPRGAEYQYREMERGMHYMRRKLQACMTVVAQRTPVFQFFTSPEAFGLMWGLAPDIRDDRFYVEMLGTFPGGLGSIPWARTGRPADSAAGTADSLAKEHHRYGEWLRRDLADVLTGLAGSDAIRDLGVFNVRALDRLLALWPRSSTVSVNALDEVVTWLASLAVFVERYGIRPAPEGRASWRDGLNSMRGPAYAWAYRAARDRLRA